VFIVPNRRVEKQVIVADSSRRRGSQMIRISVEVISGAARFRVMIRARSIERALAIAKRHNPGKECRVAFPLDPEAFFVRDSVEEAVA